MSRDSMPLGVDDVAGPAPYVTNGPPPLDFDQQAKFEEELLREPLDAILSDLSALICRYVALPSDEAVTAVALWIAHTWTIEAFETTPRLAVISPELGSGKTRLLEVVELVVREPLFASNISVAVLFRVIDRRQPTILLDEADSVFGSKKAAENHEDLRAALNAGYRQGASVYRMVGLGSKMEEKEFRIFSPVALAGIGDLPDTVMSRSVLVEMRRRRPDELVDQFRQREARERAKPIRDALAFWALDAEGPLKKARPEMPPGVTDRAADVWEPLQAVADLAGADWPREARQAALALTGRLSGREPSIGVRLLADIREVFGDADRLTSQRLCDRLSELEEAPWGDWFGKPLDPRGLARRLRPFDVHPRTIRTGDETPKGYLREDFADAWGRYLPVLAATSATTATSQPVQGELDDALSATHPPQPQHVAEKTPFVVDVADVADIDGEAWEPDLDQLQDVAATWQEAGS